MHENKTADEILSHGNFFCLDHKLTGGHQCRGSFDCSKGNIKDIDIVACANQEYNINNYIELPFIYNLPLCFPLKM